MVQKMYQNLVHSLVVTVDDCIYFKLVSRLLFPVRLEERMNFFSV